MAVPPIATTSPSTCPRTVELPPIAATSPFTTSFGPTSTLPPIRTRSPCCGRRAAADSDRGSWRARSLWRLRRSWRSQVSVGAAGGWIAAGPDVAAQTAPAGPRLLQIREPDDRVCVAASRRRLTSAPLTGSPSIAIAPSMQLNRPDVGHRVLGPEHDATLHGQHVEPLLDLAGQRLPFGRVLRRERRRRRDQHCQENRVDATHAHSPSEPSNRCSQ